MRQRALRYVRTYKHLRYFCVSRGAGNTSSQDDKNHSEVVYAGECFEFLSGTKPIERDSSCTIRQNLFSPRKIQCRVVHRVIQVRRVRSSERHGELAADAKALVWWVPSRHDAEEYKMKSPRNEPIL